MLPSTTLRPVRYGLGLLANFHRVRGVFNLCHLPGGWFYHRLRLALDMRANEASF